jgi:7-carboxy-7-deazaguanine synthase (Cx14CxxC type)
LSYAVKEIYYTLQGEGYHTGRPAVLLRFAGCNLWTGRDEDRATAICRFCDTDFVGVDGPGGGRFERPEDLAAAVRDQWPRAEDPGTTPFVVMTGGEPLLQLDAALMTALHREGLEIAVETNGTIEAPEGIDWLCVSPKAGTELVQTSGDELKLVYPQEGATPARYERLDFRFYFLQPMDGPHVERHTEFAIEYCVAHPKWRLSLQTHKLLGIR